MDYRTGIPHLLATEPYRRRLTGVGRSAGSRGRQLFNYDRSLGHRFVAGADEAGRGALAGPLVAAGVLFDLKRIGPQQVRALAALDDSKRRSKELRERLLAVIIRTATKVVVISRDSSSIDRCGLHRLNLEALQSALATVAVPGAICLSDGYAASLPEGYVTRAVVGGDRLSAAIAAASIVAKVTRDRYMRAVACEYPHWGFDSHVGYATKAHRNAIAEHGLSPLHRRSFRLKRM